MLCARLAFIATLPVELGRPGFGALAHIGPIVGPEQWHTAWNLAALPVIGIALAAVIYARGAVVRRREKRRVRWWQSAAFAAGMGTLAVALVSPLDQVSGELCWVHMVQHMLIMNVAAPLIVLGMPVHVALWNLPRSQRPRYARWMYRFDNWSAGLLWHPILLPALYAAAIWIWHAPTFYQMALRNRVVHDIEHLTFFVAALLFWRLLLDPLSHRTLNAGVGILCLFVTSVHATALGVLMTLSPRAWYSDYQATTAAWGLQPLEDQQLAGLIMWMPGCVPYAVAACWLFAAWMQRMNDRQETAAERRWVVTGRSQTSPKAGNQRGELVKGTVAS